MHTMKSLLEKAKKENRELVVPIRRDGEIIFSPEGKIINRCYTKGSNKYYLDAENNYHKSDINYIDDSRNNKTASILINKNAVSLGVRGDGKTYKYIGLRPDYDQANGNYQLEFSLGSMHLDNKYLNFKYMELNEPTLLGDKTFRLSDRILVWYDSNFTRQIVELKEKVSTFRISYNIHLKNYHIAESHYNRPTYIRHKPIFYVDDLDKTTGYDIAEKSNSKIDDNQIALIMGIATDEHIFTAKDFQRIDEIDNSDNIFSFSDVGYEKGHAMYAKDNLAICFKSNMLSVDEKLKIIIRWFKELFPFTEGPEQNYLYYNNNKVVGIASNRNNDLICLVNLKDMSHVYKYFLNKKFENVTYYNEESAETIKNKIKEYFNNKCDKIDEIVVNTEYVKPKEGRFNIIDDTSEINFSINKPKFFDENWNYIDNGIHTLKKIDEDLYEYTKYPTIFNILYNIEDIKYIDAEIFYGNSYGGSVEYSNETWSAAHSATDGNNTIVNTDTNIYVSFTAGSLYAPAVYNITRGFMCFDTSSLGNANISSCTLNFYVNASHYTTSFSVQKGTQSDTLTTSDFDNFSGSYYNNLTISSIGWKSISFNSTGISDINSSGDTKVCIREKTHDYDNVAPTSNGVIYGAVIQFSSSTNTPYLEIETSYGHNILGVSVADIASALTVSISNIKKYLGA